jgi:hypothetical protein
MLVLAALILATAILGYVSFRGLRWRRTPAELRGDWWPDFEREFRDYVNRTRPPRRDPRRRSGGREPLGP